MQKILSFLIIILVLLGTSIYAGGDGEEKLLNTNSCVNCGLSNAWLEEADLRKADFSGAKLRDARFPKTKTYGIRF